MDRRSDILVAMKTLEEKQQARFRYLKALYDKTNGSEGHELDAMELGGELGLSEDETCDVVDYLNGEHLLSDQSTSESVGLSHAGIIEVEQAMRSPEHPTDHFPPQVVHNMINVHQMVNSQILQGSPGATQTGTFPGQDMAALLHWAAEVRRALPQLQLGKDDLMDAEASLATLEAQAKARRPDTTILRRAGLAVRALLGATSKGAATAIGTALGQKLIAGIPSILAATP